MSEVTARRENTAVAAFDLKAGHFMIPTLVLRDADVTELGRFLDAQVARLPGFFDQAPVAIDLSELQEQSELDAFPMIVGLLRGHGMIPVGVRGASAEQQQQAQALEMAIMPNPKKTAAREAPPLPEADAAPVRPMLVEQPVRSGQRIYARGTDLILLGGVGSGAEVMADGHIHAYGPLRGRAMAGVSGDAQACIFCQKLEAELVSVAGRYRVSDNLDEQYVGRAVRIGLSGDRLLFRPL